MARLMNKSGVQAIMSKRATIDERFVGKKVRFTIQGNGSAPQTVKNKAGEAVQSVVEEGTVFTTIIFNLQAKSGIAMANPLVKELGADAIKAERAGDFSKAHELFTAFLNKTQLTFNVPTTSPIVNKLQDRVDIIAKVVKITTENGSLLTIDPTTIAIAPVEEANATAFSFDADDEEDGKTEEEDPAGGENQENPLGETTEEDPAKDKEPAKDEKKEPVTA